MEGSQASSTYAAGNTDAQQRQYAPSPPGDMHDKRDNAAAAATAGDIDLRAMLPAERVSANLQLFSQAASHNSRQLLHQAMPASTTLSTGATVVSSEQRLKEAACKKRVARQLRLHLHEHHNHYDRHLLHQQQRQVGQQADPSDCQSAVLKFSEPPQETQDDDNNQRAATTNVNKNEQNLSRSLISEALKCWSHRQLSRWSSQQKGGIGTRQVFEIDREQAGRNVNAIKLSDHPAWTSVGTRQTTSQPIAPPPPPPPATRKVVEFLPAEQQATRARENQTASFRLNRLLARSLADTAMFSLRPAAASSMRTARSVYVKPTGGGGAMGRSIKDARRSTFDMSASAAAASAVSSGNYAQNIASRGEDLAFRHLVVTKPRGKLVKTFEEQQAELEYAANVDGGYAWIILAVVFIINASTWGTARAYGQIFEKLARDTGMSRTQAAMPFTIMGAVENMAGPLSGCLLALTRSWRVTVVAGSTMITLAHLFAGLAADSQLGQLLAMGLMCGLGLSLVSISFFQVNNAYFVRYRNTAFGVGLAGAVFGTLIISPLCQYFLDNYDGTRACYLMLALIISPNIALALLLKPRRQPQKRDDDDDENASRLNNSSASLTFSLSSTSSLTVTGDDDDDQQVVVVVGNISKRVEEQQRQSKQRNSTTTATTTTRDLSFTTNIRLVVSNPLFHLIWPTQLIFCWFNFVFGMIIVDFGKDRGLNAQDVAHLVPAWAFGQLVGRLFLSSLVDLKFLTYKSFTIICFLAIGVTMYLLNNATGINSSKSHASYYLTILVFVLSMFIALLYILLNGLVFNYVETALQPLSLGISSFTGSFFLLPRANIIGYYRDRTGNYDEMLTMFTYVSISAALAWLILPPLCKYLKDLLRRYCGHTHHKMARKSIQCTRPYSAWLLPGPTATTTTTAIGTTTTPRATDAR